MLLDLIHCAVEAQLLCFKILDLWRWHCLKDAGNQPVWPKYTSLMASASSLAWLFPTKPKTFWPAGSLFNQHSVSRTGVVDSPFLHSRFCLFCLPWLEITRAFSLQSLPWLTCEKWIKPDLPWSDMKTEWPAMVHLVSKLAASNEANTCLKSLEWGKNQRKDVRNSTSYKSFESLAGVKICALKPKSSSRSLGWWHISRRNV